MEQFLFFCLTAFILEVNTQAVSQNQYSNVVNPDQIYFADNRPQFGQHENRQINRQRPELQPPYNTQNLAQLPINQTPFPINGGNVAQSSINTPNAAQLSTNNQNVDQNPVTGFNLAQQPAYDPNVVSRSSEEEIVRGDNQNKIKLDQTATALTNFSINVMRNVIGQKPAGSSIVSPCSIASLLALLQQGAVDQSLEQISGTLQMSQQVSAATYRNLSQDVKSRSSRSILKTANNIFVAEAFNLNNQFRAVAETDFDSGVTPTVFDSPEYAARLINNWIASKTNNKIDKLITPESIAPNTQMVLVNAIYFKGLWEVPFRAQATKPAPFQLRDGTVKTVPFMMTRQYFRACIDSQTDSKVVIVPFEREEYSLMIILPSILSNANDELRLLTVSRLEYYLNRRKMEVALKLPKFTIRADTNLTPVLNQMGVTKIFEQNSGLSGLGMYRTFTPQVSSAVHSAILSIDEEGGSAAAASAFGVVALSNDFPSMTMKVDRPFVAVLWDGKLNIPLFMAKIEDPSLL